MFQSYVQGNFDCSLWLSLTKQRVCNPLFLIRSFLGGWFEWKIIVNAWLHCGRQILFGAKQKLWVPIPAIATHLDTRSLSPGVDWRALMREDISTNRGPEYIGDRQGLNYSNPEEMFGKPTVRVVVLNWNGRDMTADCLRSLLAMQGVDFRVSRY